MTTGGEERESAIAALESEFTEITTHFRRLVARNAEAVSPGLLPGAYKVFTTITRCEKITLSGLAERMLLDKGQLSRIVRELEGLDLIERAPDPSDGRVWILSPTEYGTERLRLARVPKEGMLMHTVSSWSLEDLSTFTRLLQGLRTGLSDTGTASPSA